MTVYCIELKKDDIWAPKDVSHCKIPTEEKANARMADLITEGQDASTIRVSIDTTGPSMNPLDMSIPGQTCPE